MTAIEIINQIEADKKARKIEPQHALLTDIYKYGNWETVKAELTELWRDKKIYVGNTINSQYIKIL